MSVEPPGIAAKARRGGLWISAVCHLEQFMFPFADGLSRFMSHHPMSERWTWSKEGKV
ncbi:MAG TPA: hypothetical protein VKJ00_09325 [Thermoanaerobaculia bacterium]|nr:hypothetical protein [Thermoanaerobaculia bacterium]